MLFFILFIALLFINVLTLSVWYKKRRRSSRTKSTDSFTSTEGLKTNQFYYRGRTNRIKVKREGKYIWGRLGLSTVSKAIKKDYGEILSRIQRKHYSKAYHVPLKTYISN